MDNTISIWARAAMAHLNNDQNEALHTYSAGNFDFDVKLLNDSLWIINSFPDKGSLAFRAVFAPGGFTDVSVGEEETAGLTISLRSALGEHQVTITWTDEDRPVLHYTSTLKPIRSLLIPFWPRDIIALGKNEPKGVIHINQVGSRSGMVYGSFTKPNSGTFLYLQNLSALTDYNQDTETSVADTVGGQWPEMGFNLPQALQKPLRKGKTYTISDAFVYFDDGTPADQFEVAKGFLEAMSKLYMLLPRPEVNYNDYLDSLPKALNDLKNNKGCWSHRSGHPYLNAYLCDYQTPPEIMVQLAVLLPVQDYMKWSGEPCTVAKDICDGLAPFYNEKLGTVMRWLPSEEHRLDGSEEQKKPMVMDAWYLHHPLLNLSRMAIAGDKFAKDLLLRSIGYAIKVAHHFNYVWPVFYHMETLEVIKAETKPGEGGEKDVAGLYAHVMLQVWELTKEQKYFDEAEKAARSMVQHGFHILYQANNTMFAAKAMILLYKETKKELYRDLSYLFLANIFKNVALWECNYGFGKNFPSFFQLFPLSDAPYTAVYEEQEAYAGVHEFMNYAEGVELLPSVQLLLAEFVRYAVQRMIYYYPPMLPEDMLVKQPKTGEIDPKLWIALEDIHDGWEQSGSVGQEVYGAGLAFGIVPRQYMRLPDPDLYVFIDYPVLGQKIRGKTLSFEVKGDPGLTCSLRLINKGEKALPALTIKTVNPDDQAQIDAVERAQKGFECEIHGGQKVTITWD